jgi:hypothetical protein
VEFQLLRHTDPLEAYERADEVNVTHLQAARSRQPAIVSVESFWLRTAILVAVVALVIARVILRR